MVAGTLQITGKRFVIVPEAEYDRLRQRAAVIGGVDLPQLPRKLASGNFPAVEALRVGAGPQAHPAALGRGVEPGRTGPPRRHPSRDAQPHREGQGDGRPGDGDEG